LSNLAEWLAGTDPTNSASGLLVQGQMNFASGFVLQWPSVAGKYYRVERATNLTEGFNDLLRTNIAATPPLNLETDAIPWSGGVQFYRIGVEP